MKCISICCVLLLSVSLFSRSFFQKETVNLLEYQIGIIETKGTTKDSRIVFYDANMQNNYISQLDYATVNSIFMIQWLLNIVWAQGCLYAFSSSLEHETSSLVWFDIDLNTLDIVNTSEFGSGVYRTLIYQGCIYFTLLQSSGVDTEGALISFDIK